MTPVAAHLTLDGELYRIEGEVRALGHGECEVRIAYVYLEVGDEAELDLEDDAFDDWIAAHESAACRALAQAFHAARAA